MQLLALLMCAILLLAPDARAQKKDEDLDMLVQWCEGRYSTKEQAVRDSSYSDFQRSIKRIWNERTDGVWLLDEQMPGSDTTKLVQQRVLNVRRVEDRMIEMRVFTWPTSDTSVTIGVTPSPWIERTPDQLRQSRGCELYLRLDGLMFAGRTQGMACRSTVKDYGYTAVDFRIFPDGIIEWRRTLAPGGAQVDGPSKGGYQFRKLGGW